MHLRKKIEKFLNVNIHQGTVPYTVLEQKEIPEYQRQLIQYTGTEQDDIRAYLFLPGQQKIKGAILVHHQHNGERHLGKSEVSGITGNPQQFSTKCAIAF